MNKLLDNKRTYVDRDGEEYLKYNEQDNSYRR